MLFRTYLDEKHKRALINIEGTNLYHVYSAGSFQKKSNTERGKF